MFRKLFGGDKRISINSEKDNDIDPADIAGESITKGESAKAFKEELGLEKGNRVELQIGAKTLAGVIVGFREQLPDNVGIEKEYMVDIEIQNSRPGHKVITRFINLRSITSGETSIKKI